MKLLGVNQQTVVNVAIMIGVVAAIFMTDNALPLLALFALQPSPVVSAAEPGDPELMTEEGNSIGFY